MHGKENRRDRRWAYICTAKTSFLKNEDMIVATVSAI